MDQQTIQMIAEALKEEGIDLVVTMPEEPTQPLMEYLRNDPYFTTITVSAEGHGLAMCAGASLGGRKCVFVTGIAGLLVGSWALAQTGLLYGIPTLILASYRGDIGDRSGISGPQLFMFQQVAKPLLDALRVPYVVTDQKSALKRKIRDSFFACEQYETPIVMLLTGEVLW
ncbi:MAG TPA: thiamine pyrophosphate-binding protein [Candidatus Binatia bacterium]|jgi:sulfopyruvate decarboxylase TPP-binding subunit